MEGRGQSLPAVAAREGLMVVPDTGLLGIRPGPGTGMKPGPEEER